MSTTTVAERSFETIEPDDLRRLAELAEKDLQQLFERNPKATGRLYGHLKPLLCLCQGAAKHFVGRKHGVKDFDVWAFYPKNPEGDFPYRRTGRQDFGSSKFGRHPDDRGYQGRRIDIIGRALPRASDQTLRDCILQWLREGKATSPKLIAQRPVVAISESQGARLGEIIWNPANPN